jgi:uncharacterized protein YbjT (DUF2867 family)
MILVVGATGSLGTEICRLLADAGQAVRAMVRKTSDPAKKEVLKKLGAEFVEADLKDRTSLHHACRGATAVITTATSIVSGQAGDTFESVDLRGQINLIDAAKAAKVAQYIFISVSSNVGKEGGNPLVDAKRSVENRLQQSGLTYTILRPTFFMEIWLGPHLGFDFQNRKVTIYGSGQNKISYISSHDVARFAALSISAARDAVLELGGPEAMSPLEVVGIFEEISGHSFEKQFISEEDLHARKAAASNPLEQTFAGLQLAAAHDDVIEMSETLKRFSIEPKSVRDYGIGVLDR